MRGKESIIIHRRYLMTLVFLNQNHTCTYRFAKKKGMAKKKSKNNDGMLMEFLLGIVENILAPKSVRKKAQKEIDKLTVPKNETR